MGITLIVTKGHDREFNETGESISRDGWQAYVESAPDLRFRSGPHESTNPRTGQKVTVAAGDAESELVSPSGPLAFLRYRSGSLVMALSFDPFDERNPIRRRVSEVANHFGALITNDAGDDIWDW